MANVPQACQALASDLAAKKELLTEIKAEYATATGADKSRLFYLMRDSIQAVAQAEAKLAACIDPPPPLPDLTVSNITVRFHPGGGLFDFAAIIQNAGNGPSTGPFTLTVGLEYSDYSQDPPLDVFRERDIPVPNAAIPPGATYTAPYWTDVKFITRPGSKVASYTFYVLVDADGQIAESNEGNNNFQVTKALRPPRFILPIPVGTVEQELS